jgi:hypothetical protein
MSEGTIKQFEDDEEFGEYLVLSDESTFLMTGKENRKYFRNWGTQKPCVILQVIRESRLQFCGSSRQDVLERGLWPKSKDEFQWQLHAQQVRAPFLVHAAMQLR